MDGATLWAAAAPGSGGFQAAVDETSTGQQCALMSSGLSPHDSETASSFGLFLEKSGYKRSLIAILTFFNFCSH